MKNLVTEGRKLVTIRKINAIDPIDGADAIVAATVDGWQVVTKKDEFQVGEYCVFFEIDSFVPADNPMFAFLAARGTKTDDIGRERCRLRTIKLRGQISQGLALPISTVWPTLVELVWERTDDPVSLATEIEQLLEELESDRPGLEQYLDVIKYERPDERNGGTGAQKCKAAGNFPIVIPKTDEDRIQNVMSKYSQTMKGVGFRKSLKLDGSSQTIAFLSNPDFFVDKVDDEVKSWDEEAQEMVVTEVKPYPFQWEDGQIAICSRNLALKFDPDSHFWKAALKDDIPSRLKEYCVSHNRQLALQGEIMGPGIQGNREELQDFQFFLFRVWDIDNKCFLDDSEFQELSSLLGLTTVPQGDIVYFFDEYNTIHEAVASADHASIHHKIAEGDVFKSVTKVNGITVHFKVINNKFLLKCED